VPTPSGLTTREVEVLGLLADGLSYAEVADRLIVSQKTVGHHVSSVLRKLGEPTRSRAVAAALRRGIISAKLGQTPDVPPARTEVCCACGQAGPRRTPGKDEAMSLFIDVHTMCGQVAIDDVAKAHAADLQTQGEYGVHYLRYWVDESHGKIFCLVDAPDADAAATVHREAHGLVADEIYPVAEGT
jgi:DNA-binding CsgD family transcriptional regulator